MICRLKLLMKRNPNDPKVYFTMGMLEMDRKNYLESEKYIKKCLQVGPCIGNSSVLKFGWIFYLDNVQKIFITFSLVWKFLIFVLKGSISFLYIVYFCIKCHENCGIISSVHETNLLFIQVIVFLESRLKQVYALLHRFPVFFSVCYLVFPSYPLSSIYFFNWNETIIQCGTKHIYLKFNISYWKKIRETYAF